MTHDAPAALPLFVYSNASSAFDTAVDRAWAGALTLIAIVLLFILGYAFGRCAGRSPWVMGISMVILGAVLVGMTMALGG